ncbi:MAG TPA: polysaccharide deacetylase family protein [Candidatus Eremiobacteraceae bacterium]
MPLILALAAAVFMYHHVSPSVQPGRYARALTISPQEFGDQLAWLRAHGCAIVRASTIVADARAGALAPCEVALTFDDGYDDAAAFVAPMLTQAGATGTFFIATGEVGLRGHLSVKDVRSLAALGMELGAHTVHHVDLTQVSARACAAEITTSLAMLHAWTAEDVTDFAYPSGRYNTSVERTVAAAGARRAFTTNPGGINRATVRDTFALPRYRVLHGTGIALFASVLGSAAPAAVAYAARFGSAYVPVRSARVLLSIARKRVEGNDPAVAERIAVSLLREDFREPIEKIRVLTVPAASVAGIMLSGSDLHGPVTEGQFETDARAMALLALSDAPRVSEVDVWATVPQAVAAGTIVAGDLAAPTESTVFSLTLRRDAPAARIFVDKNWAARLIQAAMPATPPRR